MTEKKDLDTIKFDPKTLLPITDKKWPTAEEFREIAKTEEKPTKTPKKLLPHHHIRIKIDGSVPKAFRTNIGLTPEKAQAAIQEGEKMIRDNLEKLKKTRMNRVPNEIIYQG